MKVYVVKQEEYDSDEVIAVYRSRDAALAFAREGVGRTGKNGLGWNTRIVSTCDGAAMQDDWDGAGWSDCGPWWVVEEHELCD